MFELMSQAAVSKQGTGIKMIFHSHAKKNSFSQERFFTKPACLFKVSSQAFLLYSVARHLLALASKRCQYMQNC